MEFEMSKLKIFRFSTGQETAQRQEEGEENLACPKCQATYPALGRLEAHVNACLDREWFLYSDHKLCELNNVN